MRNRGPAHSCDPRRVSVLLGRAKSADRAMGDRYIVKLSTGLPLPCVTERRALQRAAELFDGNPDAEIEIYLNEVSDDAVLYSRDWMRQWNTRRVRHN